MFDLDRSPETGSLIPASSSLLLFFLRFNIGISNRQSCDLSLRNASSWGVVCDWVTSR
jgi:hypothetical protein